MSWGRRIIPLLVRVVEGEVVCNNHSSEHRLQESNLVRWHRGKKNGNKKYQMLCAQGWGFPQGMYRARTEQGAAFM